jgi:hypothetical protein
VELTGGVSEEVRLDKQLASGPERCVSRGPRCASHAARSLRRLWMQLVKFKEVRVSVRKCASIALTTALAQEGYLMGCAVPAEYAPGWGLPREGIVDPTHAMRRKMEQMHEMKNGIGLGHAYSILTLRTIDNFKLVRARCASRGESTPCARDQIKLRNPWGTKDGVPTDGDWAVGCVGVSAAGAAARAVCDRGGALPEAGRLCGTNGASACSAPRWWRRTESSG